MDTMKKGLEHLDSILENFSDRDHLRVEPLYVSKMADVPAKIREKLTPNSEIKGLIFEGHGNRTQYLLNNSDSYMVDWVMEPTGPLPEHPKDSIPVPKYKMRT
jgi:hypothetical protein